MLNNSAFDIVIGLVFIYLLYSLLGSLLLEITITNIGLRGFFLRKTIFRMLNNNLIEFFYKHPMIKNLAVKSLFSNENFPSYLDKSIFSKVLIDLLQEKDFSYNNRDTLTAKIQQSLDSGKTLWGNKDIQDETLIIFKSIWSESNNDVDKFRHLLEEWYENMMVYSMDSFKRSNQLILFFYGMAISVFFNLDTLKIAQNLQENPELRQQIVNRADALIAQNLQEKAELRCQIVNRANAFVKNHPDLKVEFETNKKNIDSLNSITADSKDSLKQVAEARYVALQSLSDSLTKQAIEISKERLAVGWEGGFNKNFNWRSLLGWLISALAISMGAPFWFDLLNKVMKLRSAVATGEKESKK